MLPHTRLDRSNLLRPRRRLRFLRGIAAIACGALLALPVPPAEASAASWTSGIAAILPADAATKPNVVFESVSCPSAGNCSAVGVYTDSSGHVQGLLVTETAGTWAPGVKATLPAGAGSNPDVLIDSVSCASAGNCAAVGRYTDSSGHVQGLLVNETAGTWAPGVKAALPADAGPNPSAVLTSVSCSSPGNCSAVGGYTDGSGHSQGLLLTEAAGSWASGFEEATLPPGAATNPAVVLFSVSCTSAGNCGAVGNYNDSSGNRQELLLTESGGFWEQGVMAIPPAGTATNPMASLTSVSCTSAGNCSAAAYIAGGSMLLTETAGTWPQAVKASPPGVVESISCTSAGNCDAVGGYTDSSGNGQGLLLTESAGTWAQGVKAIPPANAATNPRGNLDSVSCTSAGDCSAVGEYVDSSGDQGLLLTETAGTWRGGIEAILPRGAGSDPHVYLSSVSCGSAGNCGAVGEYTDTSGSEQGVLLSTLRRLSVLKAGSGGGSVTSSPAGIRCGASCSRGFASGRAVRLTARPVKGSVFAGWSGACSGRRACRVQMTTERTVTAHFVRLPNTKITRAKIDPVNHRAKFKFKARGKSKGFQCALVKRKKHKNPKPHFSRCHSPKTYKALAPGRYSFFVRAFISLGPDPTPATKKFKL